MTNGLNTTTTEQDPFAIPALLDRTAEEYTIPGSEISYVQTDEDTGAKDEVIP